MLSVLNSFWIEEEHSKDIVNKIMQDYNVSYIVARLIFLVPKLEFEEIIDFLNPKVKNLMPNPLHLIDMQKAVERLYSAIVNKEKITIFGDYDVDGATSSAIIYNYLEEIGTTSEIYIPDRILEGYGPNVDAMCSIAKGGTKLLITVDCGTVAFEPLEVAYQQGMDTIVIDHHLGVKEVPKSIAVINPNRIDETTTLKYLCGAGVSFMLVVALNAFLREKNFFKAINEPKILNLLPLVAMGTVCDVMELRGLNRAFVHTGLKVMQNWENVGLRALKEVCNISEIDEQTFGFAFGPCINAGGRIGNSALGAQLLTSKNYNDALKIAKTLFELNKERREIENKMKEDAISKIENENFANEHFIFIGNESYHQGIVGIIAARLKDKFNKPAFVFSKLENVIKCSARSVIGFDVGATINKAVVKNLLVAGGGHAMAGGFTCEIEKVLELKSFLNEEIKAKKLPKYKIAQYALTLEISQITIDLYKEVERLRPFGIGNFRPLFCIKNAELSYWQRRGQKHLHMVVIDESGIAIKGMFFNFFEYADENLLTRLSYKTFDIFAEISLNSWNGANNIELNIKDIKENV